MECFFFIISLYLFMQLLGQLCIARLFLAAMPMCASVGQGLVIPGKGFSKTSILQYCLFLCGVNSARFLKYTWPFFNKKHETRKLECKVK